MLLKRTAGLFSGEPSPTAAALDQSLEGIGQVGPLEIELTINDQGGTNPESKSMGCIVSGSRASTREIQDR